MSFKDLNLKSDYSSSEINMVEEFYEPVLSKAIRYDRISGFFDSNSLANAAKGLKEFILNKGNMRLICGAFINEDDVKSILCVEDISKVLGDNFLKDLNLIEDEIKRNHVKLIAWMIANNLLEIKIGIKKEDGEYFGGMLHTKSGLLYDIHNNYILFFGSNNETKAGWSNNIEKFKVFQSGIDISL